MHDLQGYLGEVTGLPAVTLQPAAGSQGELTGMLIFYAYHKHKGKPRTKVLIPDTAHGTNPASAALCGFKSIPVKSNDGRASARIGGRTHGRGYRRHHDHQSQHPGAV
jgi:glycine dehydrogenase subunit 2